MALIDLFVDSCFKCLIKIEIDKRSTANRNGEHQYQKKKMPFCSKIGQESGIEKCQDFNCRLKLKM